MIYKIAIGFDHAGKTLPELAKKVVVEQGFFPVLVGPNLLDGPPQFSSVDYPDYAVPVARMVADGSCSFGILICGTGIGMSMAAGKIKGIRAAVVHDAFTARASRAHNNANILCLGERVLGVGVAEECIRIFLHTSFEAGRHLQRVEKIMQLEEGVS